MPSETDPDDEDALRWEGDDQARPVLPPGWRAKGKGADGVVTAGSEDGAAPGDHDEASSPGRPGEGESAAEADAPVAAAHGAEPQALGNAGLIGFGVLGGVYLLFTIGWVIGGLRLNTVTSFTGLVGPAASLPAVWLAVLAPAIWFGTTLWLTRRSRAWLRFAWLIVGAVLLVPWPFVLVGGVGQ